MFIVAHRGGDRFGPENSLMAIRRALDAGADAVELDVRRSKDGVLCCCHGDYRGYPFRKAEFRGHTFAELRAGYPHMPTLREAMTLIGRRVPAVFDLKDDRIEKEEIIATLVGLETGDVWIASRSYELHARYGTLPPGWKKYLNRLPLFFIRERDRILRSGVEGVELMFWDYTTKNVALLRAHGITAALLPWPISAQTYVRWVTAHGGPWLMDTYHALSYAEMRKAGSGN